MFSEKMIDFSAQHIVFTEPSVIAQCVEEKGERDFSVIHSLLPAALQKRYGVDVVRGVYEHCLAGVIESMRKEFGDIVVGHYNSVADRCYVSDFFYGNEGNPLACNQMVTAGHELTHRYIYHKRLEHSELSDGRWLSDGGLEEQFCYAVKRGYTFYLFSLRAQEAGLKEVRASQKRLVPELTTLLEPSSVIIHTGKTVGYYAVCLDKLKKQMVP